MDLSLGIYNRGDYGTGHGWATSHSVGWNCDTGPARLVVQKPPTAQNYAIGCKGVITGDGPFEQPAGFIEGANRPGLFPPSLYRSTWTATADGSRVVGGKGLAEHHDLGDRRYPARV